jgi:hypothetical protein
MRIALAVVVLLVTAAAAWADEPGWRRHGRAETDLFVEVPLQYDTRVVFPFGGSHHAVPGVVTINKKAPYYCRPHKLSFHSRPSFVEHLSVKHGLTDQEIPSMVLVDHNQVRYVGD